MNKEEYLAQLQQRQMPIFGEEGCRRLRDSVVGLAGLGGGGALTLELLVRAGIGRFRLLDRDAYEPSNLNRQIFATADTIGRPKVEVAAERIKQINPHVAVEKSFHEPVSLANLEELLEGADIGMVCTDSPSSHILFKQVAQRMKLRLICGWTAKNGCGVWTMPYDTEKGQKIEADDELKMSEADALALDVNGPDDWTPTVCFAPNGAACLASSLAVRYLSGLETEPKAANFDYESLSSSQPKRNLLTSVVRRLRG